VTITVLIADALSMGISDYNSYKAEQKLNNYKGSDPRVHGIITFISFICFGIIPLLLYWTVTKYYNKNQYAMLLLTMSIAFFLLGIIQSKFTKEKWYEAGITTVAYGDLTSILAFFISNNLHLYFNIPK
jgi:VIT1/CCC1 family predicted Fe2+/Mn2+ transporter